MVLQKNKVSTLLLVSLLCVSCNLFSRSDSAVNSSNSSTPTVNPASSPSPAQATVAGDQKRNLLSFGAGAHLLKFPVPNSNQFSSHNLFDDGNSFWLSNENEGTDQVFVIGLAGETTFESFSFINGSDYYGEGSGAKDILIEVSNTASGSGWTKVLEMSLPADIDPSTTYSAQAKTPGKFLRLTVKNSQSNPLRVSLGEVKGFGEQKIDASLTKLDGTYIAISQNETTMEWDIKSGADLDRAGTYNDIYLRQEGTKLFGCDANSQDRYFNGGIDGHSAQLLWNVLPDRDRENFVMSFADSGKLMFIANLNEDGTVSRFIAYQKKSDKPGTCSGISGFDSGDSGDSQIKKDLVAEGRAVVYGINFDFNSDVLRQESKLVLDEVVEILKEDPNWRMTIEGHTDNVGGEAFNQGLSEKRAASVKNYLVIAGVAAERLESLGLGLTKPVAPNDTEIGRARNRRVELVKR